MTEVEGGAPSSPPSTNHDNLTQRVRTRQNRTRTNRRVRRLRTVRSPFIPFGLLPALGLTAVFLFALLPFAFGWIQDTTERSAQNALLDANATWASARADGQWIYLTGAPPNALAANQAVLAVRQARGQTLFGKHAAVTRVITQFDEIPTPSAALPSSRVEVVAADETVDYAHDFEWRFLLSDGLLKLEGNVPDAATRSEIARIARARISPPRIAEVVNDLKVVGHPPLRDFTRMARRGIDTISRCDNGTAAFEAARFSLKCTLPEEDILRVRTAAKQPALLGRIGNIELEASTTSPTQACEQKLARLLEAQIQFNTGSAEIHSDSADLLDAIASTSSSCPGMLRVEGHTDNVGQADFNLALSRARAEAVKDALILRGLPIERLSAQGYGESRPIADNSTLEGRARNRRIEIHVVPSPQ